VCQNINRLVHKTLKLIFSTGIIIKNRHYFVICSSEVPAKWQSICSIVADQ